MSMTDLRFLFLLYAYPPAMGTAAKRNFRISSFISKKVKFSKIFTSSSSPSNARGVTNEIESIPVVDYRSLLRRRTTDAAVPENKKSSALAQFLIRLINTFPINIIAGEGGLIYFFSLLRRGKKVIEQNEITHLYSSYRPFADHYVAFLLKKKYPHLYWIADFRDLMIDPHYNHILFPQQHHSFFERIFQKANLLTTVSDGLAKHLVSYNPNVLTLRNGVPNNLEAPVPKEVSVFTIAYSGSMFLNKRNAEPLFQAVQELFQETKFEAEDISIVYAGKDGQQWRALAKKFRFETIFKDKGIISAEEAIALQQNACINVLLTISSEKLQGVLTGKMIEYFEAGIPVLGIVVDQNDAELQNILQEIEIGDSFSDAYKDVEEIKSFLHREYLHWKKTKANRIAVNTEVLNRKYSMDAVMQPLLDKIL